MEKKDNSLKEISKNMNEINTVLKKFIDLYTEEKTELTRNQGSLWNALNKNIKDTTILNEDMLQMKRALFGEDKIGLKGVIQSYKEMNNNIQNLTNTFNDKINNLDNTVSKKINNLDDTLKSLVEETKENNIKRDTNIKILTTMCTILTSGGFLTFIAFIYKIIAK